MVGCAGSLEEESFSDGRLEYPHYTKPREVRGMKVPEVLVSGHHAKIAEWREWEGVRLTARRDGLPEPERPAKKSRRSSRGAT